MTALPGAISLTNIADGSLMVASDERNNFNAIQAWINAIETILAGGSVGQVLSSNGGANVGWVSSAFIGAGSSTVAGANTDVAYPGGAVASKLFILSPGGGSLRSVGAGPATGARLSIRSSASGAVTLKHNLAGGTGKPLFMNTGADLVLNASESIDFLYDSNAQVWVEQSRDLLTSTTSDIAGHVASGGSITAGTGFSVAHGSTGIYTITFTSAFATEANVQVTLATDAQALSPVLSAISASAFTVKTRDNVGTLTDKDFTFRATATH